MKFIRLFVFALFFAPFASMAATSQFTMAAQLLAAAKAADVQQVQSLVNSGADVNFVDSTGVSIVCTALMNNDTRAAQILQMYGADASNCDRQIKQYNNRNKSKGSGGLFSGLSSAQTISLAAAGAAVVVGGLLLLTDVFDPGNKNENGGGGDRPNNNDGGDSSTNGAVAYLSVPYSPAYLGTDGKITTSNETYMANLALWNPGAGGVRERDFNYFRPSVQSENNYLVDGIDVPMQNYLLMMHGYSAFANEYMGQFIFRETASRNPVPVANRATGGNPVAVSLVTDNGISATGSAGRGDGVVYAASAGAEAATGILDKYLNYNNPSVAGDLGAEISGFDFSGAGTALNPFASSYDSALGKIVGGWDAGGRSYGDLFGFVPNGRLGIFRTGGGSEFVNKTNPTEEAAVGTLVDGATGTENVIEPGDTITLNGVTYGLSLAVSGASLTNPTIEINGTIYRLPEESKMMKGECVGDACDDVSDIAIYVGTDGFYYVNSTGGNGADAVYVVKDNNIYVQKELVESDYKTFQVLANARGVSNVLANLTVLDEVRGTDYLTVKDMPALLALGGGTGAEIFRAQINSVYDRDMSDVNGTQGDYANLMFNSYSTAAPILVMPAGDFEYGAGTGKSLSVLDATFENYAPLLYENNLEHMFMTVVAVQHAKGTSAADSIGGYGNGIGTSYGPLYLSMWSNSMGTAETTDDIVYSSRKCGVAGTGQNGIDPWCFAAAGPTAEMATASAAGAVAALKGAFDYMSNPQIFMLMALTADGYLLGADDAGNVFTAETLAGYLQEMYSLPPEYYADSLVATDYLKAFADVYGYGLINLERAMMPGHSIYVYNGNSIVTANGNAYWRAATNTAFRPSAVLNLAGQTISAPFYDVLQSADGSISMPRVWENKFSFGASDSRGLYMGDVLGDFMTRRDNRNQTNIGDIAFSMTISPRAYDDNMSGVDSMSLGYSSGRWNFDASYQRYLTDGMSRFNGMANPVLSLASNAIVSDVSYDFGVWNFGVRAFSGAITDEGLLENDPTITAQYMPARLGLMQGAQSHVSWGKDDLSFATSIGFAHETDTLLGAYTEGLLSLGAGNTMYVDFVSRYRFMDVFDLTARATFAKTSSDVSGDFVLGMSDIYSNAFSFGANVGDFEFSIAMPLAITSGAMSYAHAEYDVVETENNDYVLNVVDTHVADLSLEAQQREIRFSGAYHHKLGEFTDGALGFIYRVNPNHTDEFGNESVFMMKLSHRLGI